MREVPSARSRFLSRKYRGGLGVIKEYETLLDDIKLSLWFERSVTPAWGIKGGNEGAKPHNIIKTSNKELELLKVDALPVEKGTVVTIQTGGGGGYGNPLERDVEKVKFDYSQGYITLERAEKEYGVIMDQLGNIDFEKTSQLRNY